MAGSYLGLFASFLLSAAMHEIVIAVPLHKSLWAPWAFIGMLGQVRLMVPPWMGSCISAAGKAWNKRLIQGWLKHLS